MSFSGKRRLAESRFDREEINIFTTGVTEDTGEA